MVRRSRRRRDRGAGRRADRGGERRTGAGNEQPAGEARDERAGTPAPMGRRPDHDRHSPAHMAPRYDRRRLGVLVVGALVVLATVAGVRAAFELIRSDTASESDTVAPPVDPSTSAPTTAPPTTEAAAPTSGFATPGLLTFRGSPSRDYYGEGPVPRDPQVLWSYPGESGGMCAETFVGGEAQVWCGTGWTGQPAVFERDGRTWVVFGAYDRNVHFVDYETGEDILPPFPTGDIVKGSVTVDPDGFPLVYAGSRDDEMHVIAIDRDPPEELWSLHAEDVSPILWNNDWDGSPLVIDDHMFVGGENSQFHVVELDRSYADDGTVQVEPELVFNTPGWDDELLSSLATRTEDVSIENSVAHHDGVVYFANSGGLVQGWDVSGVADGQEPTRVFRYWAGDDIDASIVIDDEGFLYVAVENERGNARAAEVGQLLKLDPGNPDEPLVWSLRDPRGFWATPALHEDLVIATADGGQVYGVDRTDGEVRWSFELPPKTWQSPVVVDDVLVQGSCDGILRGYDVSDTSVQPPELWSVELDGCIESTPAVWGGRLFVGARGGRFYAIGDP